MTVLMSTRRSFIGGFLSALAAPAIVHAGNIMPVRTILVLPDPTFDSFDNLMPHGIQYQWVDTRQIYVGLDFAWEPVPASRFNKRFAIAGDTVKIGDCILVERPKAVCEAARNKEIRRAQGLVDEWAKQFSGFGIEGYACASSSAAIPIAEITP